MHGYIEVYSFVGSLAARDPEKGVGWLVGEQLPKPSGRRPMREWLFNVGNMIDPGQPQGRQLMCRHRLAPRSELPVSDLN